jgi:hypothetical protein
MSTHPDDAWLRRVQALLAKAESTEFPAEAETLLAKAQELMARHAIDEAMLQAAGGRADEIVSEPVDLPSPYAGPKASLLCRVAEANGCRAVIVRSAGGGQRRCVLVGHRADIDRATTLFAALALHAAREALRSPVPPYDTPRRFRHAFLLAFANRIGERLAEAARVARVQAEQEAAGRDAASGSEMAVVLADRSDAVERAIEEQFPRVRVVRPQASSFAGARSGRAAADGAALGHEGLRGARALPR